MIMGLNTRKILTASLIALLAQPVLATAEEAAAKVIMIAGKATAAADAGIVRPLAKGEPVFSGDLLSSGVGSYVNLKFTDGGFFLLRPESRFQIEAYKPAVAANDPATSTTANPPAAAAAPLITAPVIQQSQRSQAFFRLLKGGFRTVSGAIGKINRDDYRVSTPVATIGIRGTVYSGRLCQRNCDDREEIMDLLREAGATPKDGEVILVTTVQEGEIEIETPTSRRTQQPGTTLFTSEEGTIIEVRQPPTTERLEINLDPQDCDAPG